MKCQKCNIENKNDAIMCHECGSPLYKNNKIFISHHSEDKEIAKALRNLLIKVTRHNNHFCSSDPGAIPYGDDWYEAIIEELDNSIYVICLLTENSYKQPWILYEAGIAKGKDKKKKIVSLLIEVPGDNLKSSPLNISQYCIDDKKDENLFALMKQIYEDFSGKKICEQIEKSIKSDILYFKKVLKKEKIKKNN